MDEINRREFNHQALCALTLLELFAVKGLFGAKIEPVAKAWLEELNAISKDVRDQKIKDLEYQKSLEGLYAKVSLPDILEALDFDKLSKDVELPKIGARSLPVDFQKVNGLSRDLVFGRQIFALGQGRSVIPHGHNNMATGFLVLKGELRGRHYDRLENHKDHYIIRPTIDRVFKPGEFSTISDHKDNVHWFQSESESAFIFNIHVNDTNPENPNKPGRVYVDPLGEKLSGGLVKAPVITYGAANRKFG